ncbi:MAG: iron ABC transporter permease [Desulfobacterales bacterium]|nr:iron ABC transporter permease [Desulfobacterales bacterium]
MRLPRILFAGIVGASLSLGGVVFQALLRNPLADPYVLGISGGSALGAIIGIVIGASSFYLGVPFLAFSGALITVFLVFIVAGGSKGVLLDNSLLLAGVVVNSFFSAAILFALSIVNSMELHSISFWLMGDLSRAALKEIAVAALCLMVCFVILYTQARKLNLMVQGEETALQLGVNVQSNEIYFTDCHIADHGCGCFACGYYRFCRHHGAAHDASGVRLRSSIAYACGGALFGASFLVVADTLARIVLAPAELPVGRDHRPLRRSLFHFSDEKEGP